MTARHSAPKALSILCLAASLALCGAFPSDAAAGPQGQNHATGFVPNLMPPGPGPVPPAPVPFGGQTAFMQGSLDGVWTSQTPQGPRMFRFSGTRYTQYVNGQLLDEGIFQVLPDGRFRYQVTGGPYAGQAGENRIVCDGQSLTMYWPDGSAATFVRDGGGTQVPQPPAWNAPPPQAPASPGWGQPMPATGPLEGRWVWAKRGQHSFGFIFSGDRFESFWDERITATGTFELQGALLVLRHETGRDAGRVDQLGCQISGNSMILHVGSNPDDNPIPFVRR